MMSYNKNKAFTLLEFMIAIGILGVVIMITTLTFRNILKLQQRSEIIYNLQEDSRFVLEKITQEFRLGTVDYSKQTSFRNANSLFLLNGINEQENFKLQNGKLYFSKEGEFALTNITPQSLKITKLSFYITPEQDPLSMSSPLQPRVTVIMKATQADSAKQIEEEVSLNIQTTISSRLYKQ